MRAVRQRRWSTVCHVLKCIYAAALMRSTCSVACGKPSGVEADKIEEDAEFHLGGKDIRIDHAVKASEYMSGTCFSGSVASTAPESGSSATMHRNSGTAAKQFVPLRPNNGFKTPSTFRSPSISVNSSATVSSLAKQNRSTSSPATSQNKAANAGQVKSSYWYVNWRKPQHKKHKTWDGDAYLMHKGDKLTLVTEKGLM